MPQTEESLNRFIIGKCQCNCNIWRVGEEVVYTCDEAPCYPRDGDLEEEEDENSFSEIMPKV